MAHNINHFTKRKKSKELNDYCDHDIIIEAFHPIHTHAFHDEQLPVALLTNMD